MIRYLVIVLLFFTFQSCTAVQKDKAQNENNNVVQKAKTEKPKTKLKKPITPEELEAYEKHMDEVFKIGSDITSELAGLKVKDSRGKEQDLSKFFSSKDVNVIAFVKKGCIFCENFLKSAQDKPLSHNALIMTDASHASLETFKEEAKTYKKVKGKWLYDFENEASLRLGVSSYPYFLVFNQDQDGTLKVLARQKGLVMVENQEALSKLPFAIAIQALAENTVKWLKDKAYEETKHQTTKAL